MEKNYEEIKLEDRARFQAFKTFLKKKRTGPQWGNQRDTPKQKLFQLWVSTFEVQPEEAFDMSLEVFKKENNKGKYKNLHIKEALQQNSPSIQLAMSGKGLNGKKDVHLYCSALTGEKKSEVVLHSPEVLLKSTNYTAKQNSALRMLAFLYHGKMKKLYISTYAEQEIIFYASAGMTVSNQQWKRLRKDFEKPFFSTDDQLNKTVKSFSEDAFSKITQNETLVYTTNKELWQAFMKNHQKSLNKRDFKQIQKLIKDFLQNPSQKSGEALRKKLQKTAKKMPNALMKTSDAFMFLTDTAELGEPTEIHYPVFDFSELIAPANVFFLQDKPVSGAIDLEKDTSRHLFEKMIGITLKEIEDSVLKHGSALKAFADHAPNTKLLQETHHIAVKKAQQQQPLYQKGRDK